MFKCCTGNYFSKSIFCSERKPIYKLNTENVHRCKVKMKKVHCTLIFKFRFWMYILNVPTNTNACTSSYSTFYHGYCKDHRNAAVIILRYTTLRHNGLWEVIHISSFDTMWRNPCIWSSKSCQLPVDFTSQLWCWPWIFPTSM